MNKVPDTDRMEEVIVGGGVVGSIRYLPVEGRWEFLPRVEAFLLARPEKGFLVADGVAAEAIREKSASLLAPGIIDMDEGISRGDEVFILSPEGECVGVGRAHMSAEEVQRLRRGMAVRTRRNARGVIVTGVASWDDAISANSEYIKRAESEAIAFVRSVAEKNALQPTIAYSGGKDSLATLLVVTKALGRVPLLFADSGLEFPETYRNLEEVAEHYQLEVIRAGAGTTFDARLSQDGPPSMRHRWCCSACKLEPVDRAIRERWGRCLTFIGQRKYESFNRMRSPRVWKNTRVPSQLSAAPIHHWPALLVWLYLFREHASYNRLYEMGFDRIGCHICPSSDLALFERIKRTHPDLWRRWYETLEAWRRTHDLPESWISLGEWRKGCG